MCGSTQLLVDALPEAAVLTERGRVMAANDLARHYLPRLTAGDAPPAELPQEGPSAGRFTAGMTEFDFRATRMDGGTLLLFHPAPQRALTDGQLAGALGQLRSLLAELLVEAGELPQRSRGGLQRSFVRALRLLDNLEAMRRAGGPEGLAFHPATLDLAGLCRQTVEQAATLLERSGAVLEYQSDHEGLLIPGDPALLQRALLELIANGVKTGDGRVSLRLRSSRGRAMLTLTGGGAATRRRLASMLQQDADGNLPTPEMGAGLGLELVRACAALHGGALLVSAQGDRPAVTLSLPTGPLQNGAEVRPTRLQTDGGIPLLLTALSDALPADVFSLERLTEL